MFDALLSYYRWLLGGADGGGSGLGLPEVLLLLAVVFVALPVFFVMLGALTGRGAPVPTTGGGGGMIILLIVVTVVGVVAARAIPTFLTYQQRAIINGGTALFMNARAQSEMRYVDMGRYPDTLEDLAMGDQARGKGYELQVQPGGTLVVVFNEPAQLVGRVIVWSRQAPEDEYSDWTCFTDLPPEMAPASLRAECQFAPPP